MSASDYCSVCWDEFHDDDTGGYNPSCRCGLMCRDCCKTRCDQEEPGAPMPDDAEPKTIDLMKVLTDSLKSPRREDATEPKTIAATACNTCGEQQNAAGYCTNKQCSRHGRRNDYLARREDAAGEREKRELLCEVCNREYRVWFAPNPLWNAVVRQSDGDEWEFLCPTCFTNIAAERGVEGTAFEVRLEQHDDIRRAT